MRETRLRDYPGSPAGVFGARAQEDPRDDWLGDVSDEDWSENAAERAERRHATPVSATAEDDWSDPAADRPVADGPVEVADPHREVIERRRLIAGLVLVVVLGLGIGIPVVLLRSGGEEPSTSVVEPATTTPAVPEGGVSTTPTTTTPETGPTTTTPSTTPSTPDASSFTLPEGAKLRRGEADPALVSELQRALASAGYDPGPVDGAFGEKTEAAVVAFQQDNGLSADGVVGPETAAALNGAASTPGETTPTTPGTPGVSTFTLPEGTKLRRGEGDPAVVSELQQALASAGYDPGSVDGTFGEETEAAVVAFQEASGLSADGVVGPETAAALNSALASG